MTDLVDSTGTPVRIELEETRTVGSYRVSLTDGQVVGRADFVDPPGDAGERIIFHTEVDEEFSGRGLAGLLVREALADSARRHLTVVPVCPLFAGHLARHGEEYVAGGGAFRRPTRADLALAVRAGLSRG